LKNYLSTLLLCGLVSQAVFASEGGSLSLTGAWVRALPPGQPNTAAYLTVTNNGRDAVSLVGGRTDIAGTIEIHNTREVDGLQRMEQLDAVTVAPGESAVFAPGGMHLMLLGLKRMPAPSEEVFLCLTLASGAEACTTAPVRKSAGSAQSHKHH
tara:strand:- start:35666 stop:36127 length:462 start_codon:yes stop_codon:yes gene_type:complete